jgi:AraC family transcriptional regulator
MTRVENRPLKLFLNEHCSIAYRRDKRESWTNEGRTDYGLIFLFAGSIEFRTDQSRGELSANSFLLLNPSTNCKFECHNAELLSVGLAPALVLDCAVRTRLGGTSNSVSLLAGESLNDRTLSRLAEDLAQEINESQTGHEAVIAALVEQVVIHLLRKYSIMRRSDSLELSRVGLVDRRIRRAIELMLAQLDQELSLKDLAAASYLSPFHFARLFKKLTGTTPHAYLAGLRTSTAQKLLAETDLSITEISTRVGYSSPSHFTKGFRQATGLTPRAFRRSLISRNSSS